MFTYWSLVIAWMTICVFIEFIILGIICYKLWCGNNYQAIKIQKFVKTCTIICISCGIITSLCDLIHAVISFDSSESNMLQKSFNIVKVIADGFFFVSLISLYIILISRVWFAFKDSIYKINKKIMVIIIIFIMIEALIMILYCIELVVWTNRIYQGYIWITIMIFDLLLNVVILGLFIHKLHQMVVNISYGPYNELTDNEQDNISINSSFMNDNQLCLINLITKYFLLSCIAIFGNQLFYIGAIYEDLILTQSRSKQYGFIPAIDYAARDFQAFLNAFILYLTFKINEPIYFKCCNYCHQICYRCFMNHTKQEIRRTIVEQQSIALSSSISHI